MRKCVILLCRIVGTRVRLPSAPLNNLINKQKMKVDNQTIKDFNLLRQNNLSKVFTREEIRELLFNNVSNFSKNDYIITLLVKHKALNKRGFANSCRGVRYAFTETPVHVNTLSQCIFELKDYCRQSAKRHYEKTKCSKEITGIHPISEEYCINFLKERGYRIYKQTVNYEEI